LMRWTNGATRMYTAVNKITLRDDYDGI